MQKKKTGKLFNFCLYAVGVVANKNEATKNFLSILAHHALQLHAIYYYLLVLLVEKLE